MAASTERRPGTVRTAAAVVRSRGGVVSPRGRVAEIQRARLLSAAVGLVDEVGWPGVSVADITARARISRRTFYELFEHREDCLLAVLDDTVGLIAAELSAIGREGLSWREYVGRCLAGILGFFDRERVLARFCVVQSARGGERVLERREELSRTLTGVIDAGRDEGKSAHETPVLVAEGLVGASLAIVHKRLLMSGDVPLSDLWGELMGLIALQYLGPTVARQERERSAPKPVSTHSVTPRAHEKVVSGLVREDPLAEVPMRLTYRTARVLEDIAAHPGVSNRVVADHVGITDQGQVSKLLSRLERIGLLQNTADRGQARHERNEWSLTDLGQRVTQSIHVNGHDHGRMI